ncbi:MAG: MFS transporter [Bacteroidia bacterium]|nr:MFS transporter [Bacteroidia bacterium]
MQKQPFEAWKFTEFRWFILARFSLTMAILMQSVLVGWLVYEYTKDPWKLGLTGLIEAIPTLVVALYGGYLADIYSRKKIIITSIASLSLASLLLSAYILYCQINEAVFALTTIYVYVAIMGICRGFLSASVSAFGAQLVPISVYPNMISWSSSAWYMGAIMGPAIGGLIYAWFNPAVACFTFTALMFLAMCCYVMIASKPVANKLTEPLMQSLKSGIVYVYRNKILLSAITLDLFAVLFGDAIVLLPAFANDVLHIGAKEMGYLRAAPALGALAMAVVLAYHPPLKNTGKKLLLAVAGFGLCMIVFALSKMFVLTFIILVVAGMLDNISVMIRSTILQLQTPDNMRGRVASINSIFIGSSNEIGSFVSGSMARAFTLIPSVIIGGLASITVVAVTTWKAPKLLNYEIMERGNKLN